MREIGGRAVVARRQAGELLDQSSDQRPRKRAARAHEWDREKSENFVHSARYHQRSGRKSTDQRALRKIVTKEKRRYLYGVGGRFGPRPGRHLRLGSCLLAHAAGVRSAFR